MGKEIKFKKGDRVVVRESYRIKEFGVIPGMTGTVNENSSCPWVKMDIQSANYTCVGTAIHQQNLELIESEVPNA